jgi:uncharacterized protein YndB with AHSA1/START domain
VSARTIEVERLVDAPPDRVYRMWADPDSVTQWLAYQVRGSLLPGARSELVFSRTHIPIDVLEAQPDSRFKFRWLHGLVQDLSTEVTISIRPKGWGSQVTLTDGPYDTLDEAILEEYARAIAIWSATLAQLRAIVDFSIDLRKER